MRGYRNLGSKIVLINRPGQEQQASVVRKVYQNYAGTKKLVRIEKCWREVKFTKDHSFVVDL